MADGGQSLLITGAPQSILRGKTVWLLWGSLTPKGPSCFALIVRGPARSN